MYSTRTILRTFGTSSLLLGLLGFSQGCNRPAQAKSEDAAPPIHVDTVDVTEIETPVTLRLSGSLKGAKETDLAANVNGRVVKTLIERGAEVKQGTILAQVDTSAAALSLAEARVAVATSKTQEDINKADCARYEQLKAKGAVTDLEFDQVTAKCKTAPLSLEAAQARQSIAAKNVGDGTIRAPFSGVVSERYVDVGEYVQSSSKVVSIAQINELRLEFAVPEANVAQIHPGSAVGFRVSAYKDQGFNGTVKFVSGSVRAATRDLVAEAIVVNEDRKLRPGMFADVELEVGKSKLPSVPVAAVFERQGKKRVYVVADGHLQERVLQVGPVVDGRQSAQLGLKVGEKVATGKLDTLVNGARVE
ncbi:MAG: efflux RND transporter periplasmic adaptor subunit [Proteobacteria bacterium]|nr:MAG: efflux RND transporter periplasmic adaptor subunit [Pseudomonadota bacterium]